jgi:hypothetical protein
LRSPWSLDTNPKFTVAVYQQVLDLGDGGVGVIEKVLGGTCDDLFLAVSGRAGDPVSLDASLDTSAQAMQATTRP